MPKGAEEARRVPAPTAYDVARALDVEQGPLARSPKEVGEELVQVLNLADVLREGAQALHPDMPLERKPIHTSLKAEIAKKTPNA